MAPQRVTSLLVVLFIFCALVCPAFVFAADDSLGSAGGASIGVSEPTHNFGVVSQGAIVEHSFVIQNNGVGPLDIKRIQSDCGCTTSQPEPRQIAPGQTGTIKVAFDTAGFSGEKVKSVRVFSNDPQRPSLVLSLSGTVNTEINVLPTRLFYGVVRKGAEDSKTIEIEAAPGSKVEILSITSRSELIDLEVSDKSPAKKKTVVAKLKSKIPVGLLRSRLVVKTTSKKTPVINIPVFARVEGDMRFDPPELSFGLMQGPVSSDVTRSVKILNENSSGKKVQIIKAESTNPNLTVEVLPIKEGEEYQLKVGVAEGTVGAVTARVQITTDHPDPEQQLLTLPVYGIIANKGA